MRRAVRQQPLAAALSIDGVDHARGKDPAHCSCCSVSCCLRTSSFLNRPSPAPIQTYNHKQMVSHSVELVLATIATLSTWAMCLSPSPGVYRIHKSKSTDGTSVIPLLSLFVSCHIWLLYGLLIASYYPLVATFLFGETVASIYLITYFRCTSDRSYVLRVFCKALIILVPVTLYAILGATSVTGQTAEEAGTWVGYVGVVGSIALYLSPFETIKQVITTKSAESIPIALCLAGTASNAIWVAYAIVVKDTSVLIPNAFCCVLAAVQCVLYAIYNPNRAELRVGKDHNSSTDNDGETSDAATSAHEMDLESGEYAALASPRQV